MLWLFFPFVISILSGLVLFCRFPGLKTELCGSDNGIKVSVIIPARNEEQNLPALLGSLNSQTFIPHEVTVVNDNSSDNTVKTAKSYGAKVIDSGKLPQGWLGKPWSCHSGALKAEGDLFIFLDADTFLEPDAVKKIVNNIKVASGALSIFPYHRVKKIYESFSAVFNLMQLAGMYKNPLIKTLKPIGMFGPCLVISRADYFKTGGHESVKGEVLEHYVMAKVLEKHGIRVRLFSGKGILNVRMYPEGFKSLVSGWSKSFLRGADLTPRLNMALSTFWISGMTASSILLCYSFFSFDPFTIFTWSGIYLFYALYLFFLFRTVGNFPLWSALFYPVNLLFFLALFFSASYKISKNRQTEWKGRKVG